MTVRRTFKFGNLQLDQPPSPNDLAEDLSDEFTLRSEEDDPVTGDALRYLEKGRNVHAEMDRDEYNFCYFTYVTDTADSIRVRDENNDEVQQNQIRLETADVIYFNNGQFVIQSRDDIVDVWLPQFRR